MKLAYGLQVRRAAGAGHASGNAWRVQERAGQECAGRHCASPVAAYPTTAGPSAKTASTLRVALGRGEGSAFPRPFLQCVEQFFQKFIHSFASFFPQYLITDFAPIASIA